MIDRALFLREMGLIADRFDRTISEPVIRRYYDTLNALLDDDSFARAAREIFDRDVYFPAPARFVEAARGGTAPALASAAWDRLLDAARRGDHSDPALDADTHAAMRAAGGWNAIAYASSDAKLAAARRAFLDHYTRAVEAEQPSTVARGLPQDATGSTRSALGLPAKGKMPEHTSTRLPGLPTRSEGNA